MALHIIAETQRLGGVAAFIDKARNKAIFIAVSVIDKRVPFKLYSYTLTCSSVPTAIEISDDNSTDKTVFRKAYREAVLTLNDYIYALEDISLAERLFQLLKLRKATVSVAESFTGGGISKRLVEIPGISEVYFEGLNTYSLSCIRIRLHALRCRRLYIKALRAFSSRLI